MYREGAVGVSFLALLITRPDELMELFTILTVELRQ